MKISALSLRSFPEPLAFESARRIALDLMERDDRPTAAVAQPNGDSLGYVVIAGAGCLVRYYRDALFRESVRSAKTLLCAGWPSAVLIYLLRGFWPAICSGSTLMANILHGLRPWDRILWIGGRHLQIHELAGRYNLVDMRHYSFADEALNPRSLQRCVEFIERQGSFRFCVLAVESPHCELIAQALLRRKRARGVVLCVGELNYLKRRAADAGFARGST